MVAFCPVALRCPNVGTMSGRRDTKQSASDPGQGVLEILNVWALFVWKWTKSCQLPTPNQGLCWPPL